MGKGKGTPVEKLPHSCGTRKGLQVFLKDDGTYDGWCYSCGSFVADPYHDKPEGYVPTVKVKTPEDIQKEIDEIRTYPQRDVPDRFLRAETVKYFGVRLGLNESDGQTIDLHHYPYTRDRKLSGYKVRLCAEKRIWSVGDIKQGVDFFGWMQAIRTGSPRVYITEGEIDAMALFQIITDRQKGTQYEGNKPAVISLPHGASSAARDITRITSDLRKHFREVVLVFDMDEPGQAAAKSVSKILPDAYIATLPCKDAGECLEKGHSKAAFNAVQFNFSKPKNTRIVRGSSLSEAARKKPEWGLSWPWRRMTDATRGIRRGETIYIGAGVKMGKSEIVNALGAHLIVEHKKPVLFVKPEEAMAKTYQMLLGKVAGRIFHDPKIEFDEAAFAEADKLVGDNALILDNYQFVDWETLKDDIRYSVEAEGVQDIIIDPVTCFTNTMTASESNEFLTGMAAEMSAMAKDLNFTAYLFCHLKAPTVGQPHERGGAVLSSQFAGSRAMMRSCNYMLGMEGNKDPELPEDERNLRTLVLLEDREFGNSVRVPLYWDARTGLFSELQG